MDINSTGLDAANQMANDFFNYQVDKSGLNIDSNISNYLADLYADTLYPSDTNSSAQSCVPNFESQSVLDSLFSYIIDNADDMMNNNHPLEWKEAAKQQFSNDSNSFLLLSGSGSDTIDGGMNNRGLEVA